jgi:hypothetical protein
MFPVAKEIHKPARRGSQSSEKSQEAVKTATAGSGSPPTGGMSGIAAAMSGRRRVSHKSFIYKPSSRTPSLICTLF